MIMHNKNFYRLLHARGITVQFLADVIDSGRAHVTEVLNNVPGHGGKTRRRLFRWLMPEEIEALGWTPEYRAWLKKPWANLQAGAAMRPEESSGDIGAADSARARIGEGNTGQPASCST